MKTSETRTLSDDGYLQLPEVFTLDGFEYRKVMRKGDLAIYTQSKAGAGTYFIPFLVQKLDALTIRGETLPKREAMPKNEAWGTWAFTCNTLAMALDRIDQMEREVSQPEAAAGKAKSAPRKRTKAPLRENTL